MFDDLVLSGAKKPQSRWTLFFSTLLQLTILGIMILIPLIYTEALPKAMLATMLVAPPPPPPPPPPPQVQQVVQVKRIARIINQGKMLAPTVIPKDIKMIKEEELPPDTGFVGVAGGVPGGIPGGSAGGVFGGMLGGSSPPPPKVTPKRVSVGGQVQSAKLVNQVRPIYPPLAKQARISGTVRLHAIISKDGSVQQLEMISGHPLLVQSALDAVRQWRYQPTLLNGEPVEVETFIEVVFTLSS
jgi:protein TonB